MLHSEGINDTEKDMQRSSEEIQRDIEKTLHSMSDKMERLEDEIQRKGESIRKTYDNVRSSFSISGQARRNPWITVGAAATAGFVVSEFVFPKILASSRHTIEMRRDAKEALRAGERKASAFEPVLDGRAPATSSDASSQINTLKSLAVGLALGTLRDFVLGIVPKVGESFARDFFDHTTRSLGGTPIRGRIL